jgi:hypothetical protein
MRRPRAGRRALLLAALLAAAAPLLSVGACYRAHVKRASVQAHAARAGARVYALASLRVRLLQLAALNACVHVSRVPPGAQHGAHDHVAGADDGGQHAASTHAAASAHAHADDGAGADDG